LFFSELWYKIDRILETFYFFTMFSVLVLIVHGRRSRFTKIALLPGRLISKWQIVLPFIQIKENSGAISAN